MSLLRPLKADSTLSQKGDEYQGESFDRILGSSLHVVPGFARKAWAPATTEPRGHLSASYSFAGSAYLWSAYLVYERRNPESESITNN